MRTEPETDISHFLRMTETELPNIAKSVIIRRKLMQQFQKNCNFSSF